MGLGIKKFIFSREKIIEPIPCSVYNTGIIGLTYQVDNYLSFYEYGTETGVCGISYHYYGGGRIFIELSWDGNTVATANPEQNESGTLTFNKYKSNPTRASIQVTASGLSPNEGVAQFEITTICPS